MPPPRLPALVAQLEAGVEATIRDGAGPAARRLLPLVPERRLAVGGVVWEVDWLYDGLRATDAAQRVRVRERLAAWSATLAPARPAAADGEVKRLAASILSAEEYQPVRTASWIDPWVPYLERFFDVLFAPLAKRDRGSHPWRDVAGVLVYGLLVGAMVLSLVRLAHRRPPAVELAAPARALVVPRPSAAQWRQAAEQAARDGDLAGACSGFWQALLGRLDETGRLAYEPSRTAREHVAAAAGTTAGPVVAELAALAEELCYGGRPATAAQVAVCRRAVEQHWSAS